MFQMLLYLLKLKLDDLVFPVFGEYEYFVGDPANHWIISYNLHNRDLQPNQIVWLPDHIKWRKSKWMPWRIYGYVELELKKDAYHYIVKAPAFLNKDGMTLTGNEVAEIIRDTLLQANAESWSSFAEARGALGTDEAYR